MTWNPLVFEQATIILPTATVEFRPPLDQHGMGMTATACPQNVLSSNNRRIWGTVVGDNAHVLIGSGR